LCKEVRHQLGEAFASVERSDLAVARDTLGDVGAKAIPEVSRGSLAEAAIANSERVKQALRAMEEYAKVISAEAASQCQSLRYRWYTAEKAIFTTQDSRRRLADARLYVLIDGGKSECDFAERVGDLIEAGVHTVQLRDKQLDDRTLLARARLLRRVIDDSANPRRPLMIVNDRPDLAVLARADGVHLGQEELCVHDARKVVGPQMLIGVSTHNLEQARQAVLDGASYLGCGPTFPSGTKHFEHFPGVQFLREVAAEVGLPAFAIGGITLANLSDVLASGMTRLAVGEAIWNAPSAEEAARRFLSALGAPTCC
jgi:thiamine-phosphate pyrophosphorylase